MPHSDPTLPFLKMHGAGNDFVLIEAGAGVPPIGAALARAIGDRHRGVGFDQLAVMRLGGDGTLHLEFWNADGSVAGACGNATRCAASLMMERLGGDRLAIRTARGDLAARRAEGGEIWVNMGAPVFDWAAIPLSREVDVAALPLDGQPSAVGMGNPHAVFVVADAEAAAVAAIGAAVEHDPLFPQGTNVEFISLLPGGGCACECGSGARASPLPAAPAPAPRP